MGGDDKDTFDRNQWRADIEAEIVTLSAKHIWKFNKLITEFNVETGKYEWLPQALTALDDTTILTLVTLARNHAELSK